MFIFKIIIIINIIIIYFFIENKTPKLAHVQNIIK